MIPRLGLDKRRLTHAHDYGGKRAPVKPYSTILTCQQDGIVIISYSTFKPNT